MSSNGVQGTNSGPISFPGIVSGIDYNSIISKLTSLTLAPTTALNAQITTLNNANVELIRINNYLQSVQSTLVALSNPDIYNAYDATSSNATAVTASGIAGQAAIAGAYTIDKVVTATSTEVTSNANAGYGITAKITSGTYAGQNSDTVPLIDSYAAVTPSNGSGSTGTVTVDGVTITYDVNAQSLDTILNNITTQVDTNADSGFLATLVGGKVEFTSSDKPISLGAPQDSGNLLDVLRLSSAHVLNTAGGGKVVGTANVGGIDPAASFDNTNSANFKTPVTAGTFTINGVAISVTATQSLNDVLDAINSSDAGVTATFNSITNQIVLTSNATGPQSIVLGQSGDTSNFLSASGLTTASGGKTLIGSQAEVIVQSPGGAKQTYYSNSNTVTNAITGVQLNLQSNTSTPFTINVAQDSSQLVSAVTAFVSAYNAAVSEINTATQAPVVSQPGLGSGGSGAQSVGGGVLFGNNDVRSVALQLSSIVSGFLGSGTSYNSLSQIGLNLSDNFSTYTSGNNSNNLGNAGGSSSGSSTSPIQSTSYQGTDGTLQPLDVNALVSALDANPSAVQSLLNGANGLTTQLGTYLTGVTGAPTILDSGPVGNIPATSIIQNYENTNTDTIQSLQQQITQITDNANEQANSLRSQFVASETLIAQLQAEQQTLAAALGFTVSSSSSSSGA